MLILGINTSDNNHISVSLSENDKIIKTIEKTTKKTEEAINLVYELFNSLALSPNDLSGIGVITGPGGYTGVRAGIAVAKTMAQLLDIPVISFNKTDLYILAYNKTGKTICPLVDVKRDEVYTCLAALDNNLINYQMPYIVITTGQLKDLLEKSEKEVIVLSAELTDKKEIFEQITSPNITFDYNFKINSEDICIYTKQKILSGEKTGYNEVIPVYAREAV